ncbi:cation transport protein-domain-containing protein [Geopyxis carbonaria]|nr:cation transport protein-domain-containing protein [Geopyxis carbonaria]
MQGTEAARAGMAESLVAIASILSHQHNKNSGISQPSSPFIASSPTYTSFSYLSPVLSLGQQHLFHRKSVFPERRASTWIPRPPSQTCILPPTPPFSASSFVPLWDGGYDTPSTVELLELGLIVFAEPLSRIRSPRVLRPHLDCLYRTVNLLGGLGWHVVWLFTICFTGSLALYGLGKGELGFLDAAYLSITAATGAGLGNVALSEVPKASQVVVALLIVGGGQVAIAAGAVNMQRLRAGWELEAMRRVANTTSSAVSEEDTESDATPSENTDNVPKLSEKASFEIFSNTPQSSITRGPYGPEDAYNSLFRRHEALGVLCWLLPAYILAFQLLGTLGLGLYMQYSGGDILVADAHGLNPWWWAGFNTLSSFANSGMSLLDANMTPFATRGMLVVLLQCALILAGNAAFPLLLRLLLQALKPASLPGLAALTAPDAATIFPYLVAHRERRWLAAMLVVFNTLDWTTYVLAAPSTPSLRPLSTSARLLTGFFQALSIRSGGFGIVSIRELHTSVLLLYVAMMYMTAFPLTTPPKSHPEGRSALAWTKTQFHGLMRAGDLRYLATAVWAVATIEGTRLGEVLATVFEVASAYGCVGVSFGDTRDGRLAVVGGWKGGSKAILAAVMLGGRLREVRRGLLMGWGQADDAEQEEL